ncbi:M20/M25/M40 family metallo-hydrolase [Streptomyces sp. NPDC059568]|uniref:M20/M25/M40 family metallo-hydrolase n=1 Tax=Streptomyces sp. NPDC059568 TaxID=3346868 RepID=UPI00367A6442
MTAMPADVSVRDLLADIETLVRCESPSSDHEAVARSADAVTALGRRLLDAEPDRIVIDGVTHLRWRSGGTPRVLLLGHHDTVWPLGSLETHPYSVQDGLLRGPGCFDMKAGVVMALHAAAATGNPAGLSILVTGDEEIGSPSSRRLIEEEARGCDAVFVLEASADGGALKCRRKGVSRYQVDVEGRAAHAGLEPEKGVNAGVEIAHQILALAALADPERGTTVVPTALRAGTTANTVPARASVAVDVRVWDEAEQSRIDQAVRELRPVLAESRIRISGGVNRPPLQAEASSALFGLATSLAADGAIRRRHRAACHFAGSGSEHLGISAISKGGSPL